MAHIRQLNAPRSVVRKFAPSILLSPHTAIVPLFFRVAIKPVASRKRTWCIIASSVAESTLNNFGGSFSLHLEALLYGWFDT